MSLSIPTRNGAAMIPPEDDSRRRLHPDHRGRSGPPYYRRGCTPGGRGYTGFGNTLPERQVDAGPGTAGARGQMAAALWRKGGRRAQDRSLRVPIPVIPGMSADSFI
jgi:hypothetical protein